MTNLVQGKTTSMSIILRKQIEKIMFKRGDEFELVLAIFKEIKLKNNK